MAFREISTEERTEWTSYIESLSGTCKAIEGDEEYEHLLEDENFCALLDSLIFNCEYCNWWCEMSDMGADGQQHGICRECCRDNDIEMDDD